MHDLAITRAGASQLPRAEVGALLSSLEQCETPTQLRTWLNDTFHQRIYLPEPVLAEVERERRAREAAIAEARRQAIIEARVAAVRSQGPRQPIRDAAFDARHERRRGRVRSAPWASVQILPQIQRALREHGISPSRFGREAAGDPRLVFELRRGREVTLKLANRVLSYIAKLGGGE